MPFPNSFQPEALSEMRFSRHTVLSSLITFAAGCGEAPDPPTEPRNLVIAVEALSLGSLEDGPEAFGRVAGLTQDAAGRIYVADHQAGEIRVFSPDGQHLFSFGGTGAGPGELASPCCIAWAPDGSLWVRDGGNHRYSAFQVGDSSAIFVSSRRMAHTDGSYFAPVTFTTEGDLIDVGHRVNASGEHELVRFVIDSGGAVSEAGSLVRTSAEVLGGHTVTRKEGAVKFFLYQPFSARDLVTHGPGERWAHVITSAYDIILRQGDSRRSIVGTAASPRLSPEERASAVDRMEADAARVGIPIDRLPYGVPDSKPPIQAIFFDEGGRLWVEPSQSDGFPRIADVWGTDGTLERRVQWPEDVTLTLPGSVGERSALGIRRDSLDVEYVVRLTF